MENRKRSSLVDPGSLWRRRFFISIILVLSLGVMGCQIVEPEKRAYPLVIGLDWQAGNYCVNLAMAQLAKTTGQGKEGGEEQEGNGGGALELTGNSKKEIQELYGKTRELYLDPGHVRAVIFGENLLREPERMKRVLQEMEKDTVLGNSAYVFSAQNPGEILQQNGAEVESLGEFLSGVYENRTQEEKPVTLAKVYREMHNRDKIPRLPGIIVKENQMIVDKSAE